MIHVHLRSAGEYRAPHGDLVTPLSSLVTCQVPEKQAPSWQGLDIEHDLFAAVDAIAKLKENNRREPRCYFCRGPVSLTRKPREEASMRAVSDKPSGALLTTAAFPGLGVCSILFTRNFDFRRNGSSRGADRLCAFAQSPPLCIA